MDIVIRGAQILDGQGGDSFEGDIGIRDGRIAAVGTVSERGDEEIDAKGMIATPGFVDIHTHYDGQATWQHRLDPSSRHGVTTVVMGNCGVGFAPCRAADHERLLNLMAGVEDIPEVVMADGVPWDWETYPDYLDFLDRRNFDIDVAGLVPHAALRVYVMGERASALEPATEQDRERMTALLKEALQAGALGMGTSQTINHRSTDGIPIPTLKATEAELQGLIMAMQETGHGLFQYVTDFNDGAQIEEQVQMMERLAQRSGRPVTFTLTQAHLNPRLCESLLGKTLDAKAKGLSIMAQFYPRPVGVILGHELSMNPFYSTPTYLSLGGLDFETLISRLREPEVRRRILAEKLSPNPAMLLGLRVANYDEIYPLGDPPDYEPAPETSIARLAAAKGIAPAELAYDLMLENDGHTLLYMATANYADRNLDMCRTAFCHQGSVIGLGDGGAHMGSICDASYPTFMLTHWVRDRKRGPRLALPMVIEAMTRRTARVVGLYDRGVLAPGYRADINIIDLDGLRLGSPYITRDLPTGGRRLMQDAKGYAATIVNGVISYRDGQPTGALPGRLGARSATRAGFRGMTRPERLPWIPEGEMTPAQRALAATLGAVAGGATSGPQSFLLRSPEMAGHLHELIHYLLGKSPLPRRLAEFAILIQATLWDQEYEWWAHHHLALRHGLAPSTAEDLKAKRRPADMKPDEAAVYDFCMELATNHRVSDTTFGLTRDLLGEQALADLTVISGVYTTIAMILNVAEVTAPTDAPLPFTSPSAS